MAIYVNAHSAKDAELKHPNDFLPYRDPWPADAEPPVDYASTNKAALAAFRKISSRIRQ